MSTATARAEARRKAILSRGSDRLSKLTSSARGGEDTSHLASEPPLSIKQSVSSFTGDDPPELPLPKLSPETITQRRRSALFDNGSTQMPQIDPSVWSEEQQAAFMHAMNMATTMGNSGNAPPPPLPAGSSLSTDDPGIGFLNALMASSQPQSQSSDQSPILNSEFTTIVPNPKTWLQKLLPLVHILSVWILFGFFVLWQEPSVFNTSESWKSESETSIWQRWAQLMPNRRGVERTASVQPLPFMWAFTTLELLIFSTRVLSGFDPISPPKILTVILPILPSQLSSIIRNGLRYFQILGTLLDDLAAVLVGIGFMIFVSIWMVS